MKTAVFKTRSKHKMSLLIQLAKEMGVAVETNDELTDEEMALPGPKPTKKELEEWLAKDDGEAYEFEEAFTYMKKELGKLRKL